MEPPPEFYSASTSQHNNRYAAPQQQQAWGNDDWGTTGADWPAEPPQQGQGQPSYGAQRSATATPAAFSQQPPQQQPSYDPYAKMQHQQQHAYANGAGGYNPQQQQPQQFPADGNLMNQFGMQFGQQFMSDPMLGAAANYGEQFAAQQKEKLARFVSADRLKFYFAVDNVYVGKKLGLLLFPFAHQDWSVRCTDKDEPVPPRLDVNSADLYIPLMAVLTYITLAGVSLGTQGRFTPEQLGLLFSNAIAWIICENVLILITKYVMAISQSLSVWHSLAFSSYKFVGMIVSLAAYLLAGRTFYYVCLLYCALALAFFLIRTVKSFVLSPSAYQPDGGTKRKLYLIAYIALSQPFIMWWLTSYVTSYLPAAVFKQGPKGLVPDFDKMDPQQIEALMAHAPVAPEANNFG